MLSGPTALSLVSGARARLPGAMHVQMTARRGTLGAFVVIVVGAWAIVAPIAFGADEGSQWGWNPLLLTMAPGAGAVLGGLAMLAGKRFGALLALVAGLWLLLGSTTGILWAGGALGPERMPADTMRLLLWVVFSVQAGAVVAAFGAHALGLLDALEIDRPPLDRHVGARRRPPARCEARRRRGNVGPMGVQPERLHGAARRHTRPDESVG